MKHFSLLLLLMSAVAARANDASLDFSGTPRQMSGHPSVEMKSEIVRLSIGRDTVRADCRFEFVNHGAACDVRVGFPDDSFERMGGGYEDQMPPSGFASFRSFVDGREVPTRIVKGPVAGGEGTIWRVKTVHFAARGRAGSIRHLREVYATAIGGEMTWPSGRAGYTLHTGSSWRGPIGRSEIIATFERAPQNRVAATALETLLSDPAKELFRDEAASARMTVLMKTPGNVVYSGPGRASVKGNVVRWVRTQWRPTSKDDIAFWFKMP